MKYIFTLIGTLLGYAALAQSAETVVVDSAGALAYPTAATFAAKNNLVSQEVLFVRVDMLAYINTDTSKSYYWTDVELKVLDKDGNMIYFISSVWNDRSYHSDHPELIDTNAKIAFYPNGAGISGVCAHKKVWLTQSGESTYTSSSNSSISRELVQVYGNTSSVNGFPSGIGSATVEIYPNLSGTIGGKSVREIFLNPENSILISRKNPSRIERSGAGNRIWRAAVVQYYRAMPEQN